MNDIKNTDFVIVSDLQYFVALKYITDIDNAPKLILKNSGIGVQRLKLIAKNSGVPIISTHHLTKDLFLNIKTGEEISKEFYVLIADIMIHLKL